MLKIIRDLLQKIINDIDAGNSNISEADAIKIIDTIKQYSDKTQKVSKYQACQYLNMSRASFDNKVKEGKLPQGKKEPGFKEKFWVLKELKSMIVKHH